MSLYVLKFGGSSVANATRMRVVASIVAGFIKDGHRLAVITSAMQGVTNQLIEYTKPFRDSLADRECDSIICSGEQVAAGLLASCLSSADIPAVSMNCWQVPIKVSGTFSRANIKSVNGSTIHRALNAGMVPVIAGFQGISDAGDIMTIGRGGSDATAVAVAYAIAADECFIYTDVDGVYTADPRIVLGARRLPAISYDAMLQLAAGGAKVLQHRSVAMAKACGVLLRVLSSFVETDGTIVSDDVQMPDGCAPIAISHDCSLMQVIVSNAMGGCVLQEVLRAAGHVAFFSMCDGKTSFLCQRGEAAGVLRTLKKLDCEYELDNDIGYITVVKCSPSLDGAFVAEVIGILCDAGIVVKQVFDSTSAVSVIVPLQATEQAVSTLHSAI